MLSVSFEQKLSLRDFWVHGWPKHLSKTKIHFLSFVAGREYFWKYQSFTIKQAFYLFFERIYVLFEYIIYFQAVLHFLFEFK